MTDCPKCQELQGKVDELQIVLASERKKVKSRAMILKRLQRLEENVEWLKFGRKRSAYADIPGKP